MKQQLIEAAIMARDNAHAPYSKFKVGAAVLTATGQIYTGCNIENAAYPATCCAERVAIYSAIANNERDFLAMAVVADTSRPTPPCGTCRQVMSEFFNKDVTIYMSNLHGETTEATIGELLPYSFSTEDLHDC